ncbi:MAG: hypothetical protein IKO49_07515 [Bacilli bacterium]|nr:hypothetical protein [Bacilli bacterium]
MMKYKKDENLFIVNFVIIVITISIFINVFKKYIPNYYVIKANWVIDNVYNVVVDKYIVKELEKNPYVYINSLKINVEIISREKNYYKNYDSLLLKCNMKKLDSVVDMSVYGGRKSFFKLFMKCWEE